MKVLVVERGYAPYVKEIEDIGEVLGIMDVDFCDGICDFDESSVILYDHFGAIKKKPFNRSVPGICAGVYGTFIICGIRGLSDGTPPVDYVSLTPDQIAEYKNLYCMAEKLVKLQFEPEYKLVTMKYPAKVKEQG